MTRRRLIEGLDAALDLAWTHRDDRSIGGTIRRIDNGDGTHREVFEVNEDYCNEAWLQVRPIDPAERDALRADDV